MSDAIQPSAIVLHNPDEAIQQAKNKSDIVVRLQDEKILKPNLDYGIIPGTGKKAKPTLLKPGAEKLCSAFGLEPRFVEVYANRDYDKEFFAFQYRCELYHIQTGLRIASADGECNSKESKYRWRWLWENEVDGMDTEGMKTKKTRSGQTQYRIANDDVCSQVNTILKIAQKRALVAAVLIGTNASEHFTQDIEDMQVFGDSHEDNKTPSVRWNNDPHKFIEFCKKSYGMTPQSIFEALRVDDVRNFEGTKEAAIAYIIVHECKDMEIIPDFEIGFGTDEEKNRMRGMAINIIQGDIKAEKRKWEESSDKHDPINDVAPELNEVFPEPTTDDVFADDADLVASEGDLAHYTDHEDIPY